MGHACAARDLVGEGALFDDLDLDHVGGGAVAFAPGEHRVRGSRGEPTLGGVLVEQHGVGVARREQRVELRTVAQEGERRADHGASEGAPMVP